MTMVNPRVLDFFDRYITRMIIEKYGFNEMEAMRSFVSSEAYQMLIDSDLEIYKMSPRIVFDMWESEQITGDPRNSAYIRVC